ncbi:MAG: DEAD/DEAH box helicase domain protein [Parcubacteria group bacterium GW2011_GWA2_40_14]|nr:MAG: DEAD/DEAH box helicase domain protein [Parcubacteria group bacterium GW2011_GWA2_40_14]
METRTRRPQTRTFGRPAGAGRPTFGRPSFGARNTTNRAPFRGSRVGSRPGMRSGGGRGRSDNIHPSRFVNRAVITEKAEHFVPEHNFTDFQVEENLKKNIVSKGYVTPTPIQDKTIPHILKGQDVVGIANTGTGKTAAYLVPLIHKVLTHPKENVLIMVPTRELALQIQEELKDFTIGMRLYSVVCVGGTSIGNQIRDLRYRNEFVIGTPGRLKDLIERKVLNLSFFKTVVLDEADRMLDMGFINDMRNIMAQMPKPRHTLFFSATLSGEIEKLIKEFLREPVMISVKTQDTAKGVDQDVVRVSRGDNKLDVLHSMLIQPDFGKVLIFGRTKHGVEKLTKLLVGRGFKAESIHGNKNQSGRQRSLKLFKEGKVQILVATDVAARGLDISDVSHVINFDLPATYDDYVHRIGRTGRAGKSGKALTFVE